MKVSIVLALAGLGAAVPAVINKPGDVGSLSKSTGAIFRRACLNWVNPQCSCEPDGGVFVCWRESSRQVEAADTAELLDDESKIGSSVGGSSDDKVGATTKTVLDDHFPDPPEATDALLPNYPPWNCQPEDVVCLWRARRAVAAAGDESSDDEVEVSVGPGSTRTMTATKTSVATTTKTQTQVAPTTTRTATITSTKVSSVIPDKTTSKPTPSATPVDSSDDEAEASLDADLEMFQTTPFYSHVAQQENTPYSYVRVIEDRNKTAIHQAIETNRHDEYDAHACARRCNEHRACQAFAIYIERQPSCNNCSDPETVEANKCDLYNTPLKRPDIRKESHKQDVGGKEITRAVRAYNGYNKIRETATVTATHTHTVTVRVSGSAEVSIGYKTHTVTTTARPATTTVHHTISSGHNSTVTHSASASTRTVTSTKSTATLTRTSTKSGSTSSTTVTKISTRSGSASPATVTKTSTRSGSASPTTVTRTSTHSASASPTTVTKTSIKSIATVTKTSSKTQSASPTTVTSTRSRTIVISASASAGTVTSTKTRTRTAMFTTTKPPSPSPVAEDTGSDEEGIAFEQLE